MKTIVNGVVVNQNGLVLTIKHQNSLVLPSVILGKTGNFATRLIKQMEQLGFHVESLVPFVQHEKVSQAEIYFLCRVSIDPASKQANVVWVPMHMLDAYASIWQELEISKLLMLHQSLVAVEEGNLTRFPWDDTLTWEISG